jgi:hypothetical protein
MKKIIPLIYRFKTELIAIGFSAYGMVLRCRELAGRELWLDEKHSLKAAVGGLKPFWQRLDYGELTSFPGEYLLSYP